MTLTPTHQVPASSVGTIEIADGTVTEIWSELLNYQDVRKTFIRAVRKLADGLSVPELYAELEDRDVPHWIRSRIRDVALGNRREAWHLVADVLPSLGKSHSTIEDIIATAGVFGAVNETGKHTLAVVVGREFTDLERRDRVPICRLIATLAQAFDVRFVATTVTRAFVRNQHREDLPGVSEWRVTDREQGPLGDVVENAIVDLDPDGREVRLLRALEAESSETLAYSQAYAEFAEVQDSRVRQTIGRLAELGLVATFGPQSDRKVELLEAGNRVLKSLSDDIGRQSSLEESVKNFGKSSPQCRVTPRTGGEGEDGPRPYDVGWMSQHNHAATVACGHDGGVTLAPGRLPDGDGRTHEVSYDADADHAVVAVQASGPLPYAVSNAVALATPWFVDRVLPESRIKRIDEPPEILRGARQIGELPDEALDDPEILRDRLVEWGQRIQDLTVDLRNGKYDDRDAFRSEIIRQAHGLTGSITHLLDAAGVDLTRELRVPAGADRDDLEALSKTVAISTAIQSRYAGVHNAYRQLFEDREEKREGAFTPEIDAADPRGRLIGSLVIRGTDLHRVREPLKDRLAAPRELHDDAPGFSVPIPIREAGRGEIATVANAVLLPRRIKPTDDAVSICHSLVPDPYAVACALEQLGAENRPREIRPDEIRYALSTLETDSILPDLPPTTSSITAALLAAEASLSQTELAERADVSTRSVRNNADRLETLGLLEMSTGYRLTLSFQCSEERRNAVTPTFVGAEVLEVADALLEEHLPPDRYGDLDDSLGRALFWPPDPWLLLEDDDLASWAALGARLTAAEQPDTGSSVTMGADPEQTSIHEVTS